MSVRALKIGFLGARELCSRFLSPLFQDDDERGQSIGEKQDPVKDNGVFPLPEDFFPPACRQKRRRTVERRIIMPSPARKSNELDFLLKS
jgi:hypothetical protein